MTHFENPCGIGFQPVIAFQYTGWKSMLSRVTLGPGPSYRDTRARGSSYRNTMPAARLTPIRHRLNQNTYIGCPNLTRGR